MTFLNPAVLIGLLAAAFPLVLHLLNLRKLRIVEFSTLSFLKELQKSTLRRLKFQYWLLLLLRTLLIVFIVLAFARPVLRGTFAPGIGSRSTTTMVIILDDSYSMGRSDDRGVLFLQAQSRANELLSLLNDGDDGLVLKLSDGGTTSFGNPTQNINLLKTIVSSASPSAIHRPFDDALRCAARMMEKSKSPNREIYILSDMQAGNIEAQGDSASIGSLFRHDVGLFFVPFGRNAAANAGIVDARVENTLLDVDRPFQISATVKNFGKDPLHTFVVSAYLENTRVQQKTTDLNPQQSSTLEFSILPRHRGLNRGSIRIEDDQCEYDNSRFFAVTIPQTIRILLAAQSPADMRYIRTALALSQSGDRTSIFSISSVQWSGLTAAALHNADVVVCSISNESSDDAMLRCKDYVAAGGTLVVFPSSSVTPAAFDRLASTLALAGIDSFAGDPNNHEAFRTIEHTDVRHPIFNGMFEPNDRQQGKQGGVQRLSDGPQVYRSVVVRPSAGTNTLVSLSDGNGFLTEYSQGEGKVLVFAVPPTPEWSDFPLKGLFVPLLYRVMLYAAPGPAAEGNPLCGDAISFTIPDISVRDQAPWSIVAPDSDATIVKPQPNLRNHSFLVGTATTLAGIYTLMHGSETFTGQAVTMDPKESDLTPAAESALRSHFAAYGIPPERVRTIAPGADVRSTVLESRYGVELWRFALAAAVACALLEMLVAYLSKRSAALETP